MKLQIQRILDWHQLLRTRLSHRMEVLLVGLLLAGIHALVFLLLQLKTGYTITGFIFIPILIVAWFFGLRLGIYASILGYLYNILLITALEQAITPDLYLQGLMGHVFTLVAAIFVGKFKELSQELKREMAERNQIEQTIQVSERKFRLLSENLNDLICLHELDSTLIYLSSSVEEILGYSAKELLGKKPFQLFHPDDVELFRSHQYLQSVQLERDFTVEGRMQHKDGHFLWVESRIRPFVYENDDHVYWQSITRDISELKARTTSLKQAKEEAEEANRVKGEFLANMSHEIRTPMNAIIGLTGLLLDTPLNLEQQDFLQTIRTSSDGLLDIINNILDFSKIEAGKLELETVPFNLHECVEDSLDLNAATAYEKGLELAFLISDDVPDALIGDVTRLRQILVNLVSNAVKFTDAGEVFLSVTQHSAQNDVRELRFSVVDTGIGISAERMDRLFRSFSQVDSSTTRQYGGTGLGLVISKRLAEAMGGRMWVESEPNKGSTFSFTIMANALVPGESFAPEPAVSPRTLNNKRILVVDDNDVNRLIMKHYLYRWQAESHIVNSGEEALNLLAQGQSFDLGILDMQMPTMDGVMLAQAIQALPGKRPFPLILLSSLGQIAANESQGLFVAQITKPVKPNSLHRAIEQALGIRNEVASAKMAELVPAKTPHHNLSILLAEDNIINQKVALSMLERIGYNVGVAANGHEVLAALRQQSYDIILMDVQMPEMDGLVATQLIRQNRALTKQPYIIALTANALKGDRERFLSAGMDDYLSKPVRLEELANAIDRCPLASLSS